MLSGIKGGLGEFSLMELVHTAVPLSPSARTSCQHQLSFALACTSSYDL